MDQSLSLLPYVYFLMLFFLSIFTFAYFQCAGVRLGAKNREHSSFVVIFLLFFSSFSFLNIFGVLG